MIEVITHSGLPKCKSLIAQDFAQGMRTECTKDDREGTQDRTGSDHVVHRIRTNKNLTGTDIGIQLFDGRFKSEHIIHLEIIADVVGIIVGILCEIQFRFFECELGEHPLHL